MRIRLTGTPQECVEVVRLFEELNLTDVIGVSRDYKNYGSDSVRVYLNIELNYPVVSTDTTISNKK